MYIPTNMIPYVVPSHGIIRFDYISEVSLSAVPNRQFPQPFVPYFDSLRRLMLRGCSQVVNCKPGIALQICGVIALMRGLQVFRLGGPAPRSARCNTKIRHLSNKTQGLVARPPCEHVSTEIDRLHQHGNAQLCPCENIQSIG